MSDERQNRPVVTCAHAPRQADRKMSQVAAEVEAAGDTSFLEKGFRAADNNAGGARNRGPRRHVHCPLHTV